MDNIRSKVHPTSVTDAQAGEDLSRYEIIDRETDRETDREKQEIDRVTDRDREMDLLGSPSQMQFSIDSHPPWYLCILLGFQHYLTMLGTTIALPLILAPAMCIGRGNMVAVGELISTSLFVSGIGTFIQCTFGTRLPIIQGGTISYVISALAILSLDQWKCPIDNDVSRNNSQMLESFNQTSDTVELDDELWKSRIRELQGAIIIAPLFEVFLGFSGLVGLLTSFIGPVSITPIIMLIGLALFRVSSTYCASNWWMAFFTIFLITLFSQYLSRIEIPCNKITGKASKQGGGFPLFRLFPVILGIALSWLLCLLLTVSDAIPNDPHHWAVGTRTDLRSAVIRESSWFRIPYPFQWGWPTFSVSSTLGMLPAVLAGLVESIGDYYACARLSEAPTPPVHVISRGIFLEGLLCIMAGTFGTGTALTSYSENIGAIGLTKVASRRVIQFGAVIMLLFGVLGKFGALFVALPDPIVGGVFVVMFGMIVAVGMSNLQFVDLNSNRNLFIIGVSILLGLALPQWFDTNPNAVNTGVQLVDQIVTVLGKTSMFVGGALALFLDNTIPGTDEERGITKWLAKTANQTSDSNSSANNTYDLPCGMDALRRWPWTKYVPVSPTFVGFPKPRCVGRKNANITKMSDLRDVENQPEERYLGL